MNYLKDNLKLAKKNPFLMVCGILLIPFMLKMATKFWGLNLEMNSIFVQLDQALKVAYYLFIGFMFLSYEYISLLRRNGMEEVCLATPVGMKRYHIWSGVIFLSIWSMILTVTMTGVVILEYKYYNINDPHGEYIFHILKNMLIYYFGIFELAILIGLVLSKVKNRILSYVIMISISYLMSPYLEKIADAQCMAGNTKYSFYPIVEIFHITPLVDSDFAPNTMFGNSVLSYQICLIFFWMFVCLSAYLFLEKASKIKIICSLAVMLWCFNGYISPHSVVNMNGNPANTLAHDQYYYSDPNVLRKDIPAEYKITAYDMTLEINRQLNATVCMSVDKQCDTYDMTLYHGYKVTAVENSEHKVCSFIQEGDYISVKCPGGTKSLRLHYQGSSPAYYSNEQGTFLPGNFAYYPRAGHLDLFNDDMLDLNSYFVDPETEFTVRVKSSHKIYTNLDICYSKDTCTYHGKCDGFTVISGFYKEAKLKNGNRLIYNYLSDVYYVDGGLDEICKEDEKVLQEANMKNTTIFVVPNVNQSTNRYVGRNQILSRNSPWI